MKTSRRKVLVVTGSRADYGLLRPVMEAVRKHKRLQLRVAVGGEHLLGPAHTWKEVARDFRVDAKVLMQRPRDRGRADHAAACGRGLAAFAAAYKRIRPDWVVVLGDRIEAFAAASAASIAGIAVCHIHGGDRAEGIADEAMRHAITKLSHLHCVATSTSAERIRSMGEPAGYVSVTGSPAIDGLKDIPALGDSEGKKYGDPRCVVLLHPSGLSAKHESFLADAVLGELWWCGCSTAVVLAPNTDPGSESIGSVYRRYQRKWSSAIIPADLSASGRPTPYFVFMDHLPRRAFVSLLRRIVRERTLGEVRCRGFLIGNSSAGLIEAAAIGLPAINIGNRQAGRERAGNVIDVPFQPTSLWTTGPLEGAIREAMSYSNLRPSARFGDGRAGPRIAALLATIDPHDPALLRKRNSY